MTGKWFSLGLCATLLFSVAPAAAQGESGRVTALEYLGRGSAAFRSGDMIGATRYWSEAIRLSRLSVATDLEAQALARRGETYRIEGYFRDAKSDLETALVKAEQGGDQALIAASSGALGNLAFMLHRAAVAEPLLNRSREIGTRLRDLGVVAASDNDLGNLYASTRRPAEAANAYSAAIASAGLGRDDALAATAEINLARLDLHQQNAANARALLTRAVDRLERLPPSYTRAMALVSAGTAVFESEEFITADSQAIAVKAFQMAEANGAALHNAELLSLALGSLAHLYERSNRLDEALELTDRAALAAQQASAPEYSFRWDWQRARLARERGQPDQALVAYRRAIAGLQSIRQDIPVEYRSGRSSYRIRYGPLYLDYSDLLLRRARSHPSEAPELIREARETIEELKETELQDYFRDSCLTAFLAKRRAVETIAPGTAVIYPIALTDRLELLVTFGNEEREFTSPIPAATLRAEVQHFRFLLEKRTTNEYLVPAHELYQQIIGPIEPVLAAHRIDTLVIVPDFTLRAIPFAALYDGRNFLIDHYATAISPGLHLTEPKPLYSVPGTAFVAGISQSIQGYTGLPNVKREIAAVHQIEGGDELLNDAFTRARFQAELQQVPYSVVHIASHGQFGTDPSQTFVLTFDGHLTMDDLEQQIKFGERREEALELLVLSACETAAGDDQAVLGLAGVALKSGARSAVATLWYISDKATGELIVKFYRALQSGTLSKARALQQAQRELAADPRFAHPAYWAPLVLIGNWL
jgi:CHAT domain-containing protein